MATWQDRDKYLPAYQKYLENVPMNVLKCRIYGHQFGDLDDELKKKNSRAHVHRSRLGTIIITLECRRKCGTTLIRFRTSDGYRQRANKVTHTDDERSEYDYENPGYKLPPEARSGHGITAEMYAMARVEELARLEDWITEE
jgi:hypothetical protein